MIDNACTKYNFQYGNKSFWCWETSVADYVIYLKDPSYFLEKKLGEGGKKVVLTESQAKRFIKILLDAKENNDLVKSVISKTSIDKKTENTIKDIHVWIGIVGRVTNINPMGLPLSMFWRIIQDIGIINGSTEYDPMRNEKTLDSKSLYELTGGKRTL